MKLELPNKEQVVQHHAAIIFQYLSMENDPAKELKASDAIVVFCSTDFRVAHRATALFKESWAPLLIISGGYSHVGDLLDDNSWEATPAEMFAAVAIENGVPKEKVVVENKSTNIGENIRNTMAVLEDGGIEVKNIIVVQKTGTLRRSYTSVLKQWTSMEEENVTAAAPEVTFKEYVAGYGGLDESGVINLLVGDLERMKIYAEKGYQIPQEIPEEVWDAYNILVEMGYNKHLIK